MSAKDMGIDLGTANTLVYLKSKGIVLNEPSVVAISDDGEVIAVGLEAKEMLGRTHDKIKAVRPLKDGVIADFEAAGAMLSYFITKALGKKRGIKPRAVICVPMGITAVEEKAVTEAAIRAGIRSVCIMKEPMAAAIGAGLDVNACEGMMVVDIGGGTSEVAVISLGGIVTHRTIRIAGDSYNEAVSLYIRKKYNIHSGLSNAEKVKIQIGTVSDNKSESKETVCGRDSVSGMPSGACVTGEDIKNALAPQVAQLIETIKHVLEDTPPELSADILKNGIVLTGGGALLDGLPFIISQATGIKVRVADEPLSCVALGAGSFLSNNSKDIFK